MWKTNPFSEYSVAEHWVDDNKEFICEWHGFLTESIPMDSTDTEDSYQESLAWFITSMALQNVNELETPLLINEDFLNELQEDERYLDLYNNIHLVCTLQSMINKGIIEDNLDDLSLTPFGNSIADALLSNDRNNPNNP